MGRVWTPVLCGLVLASGVMMAAAPVGQYELGQETVRDRRTGLVWQRNLSDQKWTLEQAEAYCAGVQTGGLSGWRLPTVAELQTLVDVRTTMPAADTEAFKNMKTQLCWTSTPYLGERATESSVWGVNFGAGLNRSIVKTGKASAMCVR